MIVYDVIQIVSPGHVGSNRVGEHFVLSCDSREDAEELAESFNRHTTSPTLKYEVEEIDELSPDRKMPENMK